MKKVIIASKNPVKINAVKIGFMKIFPSEEFEFVGVSVPSEVADQPMTSEETLLGAENRAKNAMQTHQADYWAGVEGGIELQGDDMQAFAWIVIADNSKKGKAQTGIFILPQKVADLVRSGKELGEADDIVFGHSNSKQKNGAVGLLTKDVIDRTSYYAEAVVLALIPFINQDLY
ncbi:MAG: inosine/xanthosine triphosphatase [Bacteroidota bacterium]